MKNDNNTFAVILLVVLVTLMIRQFVPGLRYLFDWPRWGFLVAGVLILIASFQRNGELALVAGLLAGVSANLLLQRQMGLIIWASMLAFLGVGVIISEWIEPKKSGEVRSGLVLMIISVVVFLLAGGTKYLPWSDVELYWPIGLVILGLLFLINARSSKAQD